MTQQAKNAAYMTELKRLLLGANSKTEFYKTIVNAPFFDKISAVQMHLGIVVFLLVNEHVGTIDRIALSDTELAHGAVSVSAKPFHDIKIPIHDDKNIISEAVRTKQLTQTGDWQYLFTPALSAEDARFNQAGAAIGCSLVSPFYTANEQGALIFSFYEQPDKITTKHTDFVNAYTGLVADAMNVKVAI